jgi:hypothetical protein
VVHNRVKTIGFDMLENINARHHFSRGRILCVLGHTRVIALVAECPLR